jgi:hypothetical protein
VARANTFCSSVGGMIGARSRSSQASIPVFCALIRRPAIGRNLRHDVHPAVLVAALTQIPNCLKCSKGVWGTADRRCKSGAASSRVASGMMKMSEPGAPWHSQDARKPLARDWPAVMEILAAVEATGFVVPPSLRRPQTDNLHSRNLAGYRWKLRRLGGMLEAVFVAESIALRPPPAKVDDHTALIRHLAVQLEEALRSPYASGFWFLDFMPKRFAGRGDVNMSELLDDLKELRGHADSMLALSNEPMVRLEGGEDPRGFSSMTPLEAWAHMLERVFRDHVAQSAEWVPNLRNSKVRGVDEFTAFALALSAAKGRGLRAESFQRMYRRARARTSFEK